MFRIGTIVHVGAMALALSLVPGAGGRAPPRGARHSLAPGRARPVGGPDVVAGGPLGQPDAAPHALHPVRFPGPRRVEEPCPHPGGPVILFLVRKLVRPGLVAGAGPRAGLRHRWGARSPPPGHPTASFARAPAACPSPVTTAGRVVGPGRAGVCRPEAVGACCGVGPAADV